MKSVVFLFLTAILLFFSCKTTEKTTLSVSKTIPYFTFYTLDNQRYTQDNLDDSKTKVIIYFNSECEHCQRQGKWLSKEIDAFNICEIIFISHETKTSIKDYQNKYFLENKNIRFLQDSRLTFGHKFGTETLPSILIYDKENKLKASFLEETKPEIIIPFIK